MKFSLQKKVKITSSQVNQFVQLLHDEMTQERYEKPLESFTINFQPKPWTVIDIINNGPSALEQISHEMGLAFDEWDIKTYHHLFAEQLKRNPTSVECFDLAQSNSEHSRHWFFRVSLTKKNTSYQAHHLTRTSKCKHAKARAELVASAFLHNKLCIKNCAYKITHFSWDKQSSTAKFSLMIGFFSSSSSCLG